VLCPRPMAEATTRPKKAKGAKKNAKIAFTPPPKQPDDGLLGWGTWATFGVVLVGGVVAWKLVGTSYKRDVGTICNGEQSSGFTMDKESSKVSAWIRDHLGTPQGNELYSALSDARGADRPKKLQDEADKVGITPCPMVQSYQQLAAQAEYRGDLQKLCSTLTFPKLLASDDPTRLGLIEDWIDKNAKSPRTKELAEPLRQAQPGTERAHVLREAAAKLDVLACENAKSIENPPPPMPTGAPVVRLYSDAQIIGGLHEEDVKKALADATPALTDCYTKGIERHPDLAGRLTVKVEVDPNGNVTKDAPGEDSSASVNDRDTVLCIAKVVRTFKFPNVVGPMASILLPIELTHLAK
jgi:hypothetical protein